ERARLVVRDCGDLARVGRAIRQTVDRRLDTLRDPVLRWDPLATIACPALGDITGRGRLRSRRQPGPSEVDLAVAGRQLEIAGGPELGSRWGSRRWCDGERAGRIRQRCSYGVPCLFRFREDARWPFELAAGGAVRDSADDLELLQVLQEHRS